MSRHGVARHQRVPQRAQGSPGDRRERGSGTALLAFVAFALVVATWVGLSIALAIVGSRQARAAADLGALAGASAQALGEDACAAAEAVVARDHARVTACSTHGDRVQFVVVLEVAVRPMGGSFPGPSEFKASAEAGSLGAPP